MDRATRDKFVSSKNDCWETAPEIFAKLSDDFGPFEIDLTADRERALVNKWFGPGEVPPCDNALTANWIDFGTNGYSNPPYGWFIGSILEVAIEQAQRGFTSTLLLPLRVTKAFRQFVLNSPVATDLFFCDKRLVFYENGKPRYSINKKTGLLNKNPDTALFDSIIVRYLPFARGLRVREWAVPPHGKASSTRRSARVAPDEQQSTTLEAA